MILEMDYCLSLPDIQKMSEYELRQLLICSKVDANNIFRAECTYYMCLMEENRRRYDRFPYEMDVISYVNIRDEDHEIIFGYGRRYSMYVIEGAVLVYDDNWVPYIFGSTEEDIRCVWKYFCVSREDKISSKSN